MLRSRCRRDHPPLIQHGANKHEILSTVYGRFDKVGELRPAYPPVIRDVSFVEDAREMSERFAETTCSELGATTGDRHHRQER